MVSRVPVTVPVIDFRRQRLVLEWNAANGTWQAFDVPPALVHGVALIRADQPNICLFARDDRLNLQIGGDRYELSDRTPRILWRPGVATFGLRRRFVLESGDGARLFSQGYWRGAGEDFFSWLASRTADPAWRGEIARRWSAGVPPEVLRAG